MISLDNGITWNFMVYDFVLFKPVSVFKSKHNSISKILFKTCAIQCLEKPTPFNLSGYII